MPGINLAPGDTVKQMSLKHCKQEPQQTNNGVFGFQNKIMGCRCIHGGCLEKSKRQMVNNLGQEYYEHLYAERTKKDEKK